MGEPRKLRDLVRETYGPLFPTPKKKKEEFLNLVREKVDYYKPRIEEMCKIELGTIRVKDNKEWLSDVTCYLANMDALENAWKQGRIPKEIDFKLSYMTSSFAEALNAIPLLLHNSFSGADMRYFNGAIYVQFYYMNRFTDIDFKERTKELDYTVVHELSHGLWAEIAGNVKSGFGEKRTWSEGFATYCADEYFADLYPEGALKRIELGDVYNEGKKKIEDVVTKHGEGILLEIPRRGKEFSEETLKR
jgi:hypothetical protein